MTAGLYAVSLAGVTSLQAATDAQLGADRAPAAGAVEQLRDTHDAMERRLEKLATAYSAAASGYTAIAQGIAGHEQALAALGDQVTSAAGTVSKLSVPAFTFSAPTVARPGAVSRPAAVARPSSGSGSPAAGSSRPAAAPAPAPTMAALPTVAAAPPAAAKPTVNACTTASGKPC